MLRWGLPAVRAMGGRGCASFNIRAPCSTHLTNKLALESPRSLYNNVDCTVSSREGKIGQYVGHTRRDNPSLGRGSSLGSSDVCLPSNGDSAQPPTPEFISQSPHYLAVPGRPATSSSSESTSSGTSAVQALKALLSPDNLTRSNPTVYTANTIRSMYRSAKAYTLLQDLTASEFSALISLFGTLSLSSTEGPYQSIYSHPLAVHIPSKAQPCRSYWSLVGELVAEKHRLLRTLDRSDHFYGMHAKLNEMKETDRPGATREFSTKTMRAFQGARRHYLSIRSSPFHPLLHLPYLEALLHFPECVSEAVYATCDIMDRLPYINTRMLDYLWRLIVVASRIVSPDLKMKILRSLSSRAHSALARAAQRPSPDTLVPSDDTLYITVDKLVDSITSAVACNSVLPSPVVGAHPDLLRWSLEAITSELSLDPSHDRSVDVVWTQLLFLANSRRYSLTGMEDLDLDLHSDGSWSWRAMCILSRVENALQAKTTMDPYDSRDAAEFDVVRRVLSALWYKWTAAQSKEPQIFSPVASAITASFLGIARRTGHLTFVENSWPFLKAHSFFGAREVAVEYCTTTIAHGHDIRHIFMVVLPYLRPASRSLVVQDVLLQLLATDIALSMKVYAWARQSHTILDSKVIRELAVRVAARGNLLDAIRYAEDPSLQIEHKLDVLTVLLQCAVDPSRELDTPRPLAEFVSALVRTTRAPAEPPKGFEESLLAALMMRRLPWLPHLVASIQRFWPTFFSARFLTIAAKELVWQRQPRIALRLLIRGRLVSVDTQRVFLLELVRTGAYKTAASMLRHPWPPAGQGTFSARALRLLRNGLKKTSRPPKTGALWAAVQSAAEVNLLSKFLSQRLPASKISYLTVANQVVERNRTAIGNSIIHANFAHRGKRQARRVRRVLEVFKKLRDEQGFVPDRVTVNILLKAILHWTTAVDSQAVRALFNRMIRSGYPAGDSFPPNVGPFRTQSESPDQFQMPEVTSPISYSIHVRPLYKMFIKALYLRGDAEGARVIVGILKGLDVKERLRRVQRVLMP